MNEMNPLENQLRAWRPRRPSAGLRHRIFAAQAPGSFAQPASSIALAPPPPFRLSWLVPATATMLLLCVLSSQRNGATLAGSANSGPLVAMILSNQSAAASLPATFQRSQNGVPSDTFEWTNTSGSTSSISSPSGPRGSE